MSVGDMAIWAASYGLPLAAADTILKSIIGTYGTIKQFDLYERQTDFMERGVEQAQDYLALANRNYSEIAMPTQERQRALFDRFLAQFAGYEPIFLAEANRLREYTPAYDTQEGRALAAIRARFDRAGRTRRRQQGRYSAGRVNDDAVQFAIATALAQTDAANAAFRYEDAKKISLDEWYWTRVSDGIKVVGNMQGSVISGLNGGAAGTGNALNGIGNATGRVGAAMAGVGASVSNSAQAYSSLANGAMRSNGYGSGGGGFDKLMGGLSRSGASQQMDSAMTMTPMQRNAQTGDGGQGGDFTRTGSMTIAPTSFVGFAGPLPVAIAENPVPVPGA